MVNLKKIIYIFFLYFIYVRDRKNVVVKGDDFLNLILFEYILLFIELF